jgi:hypothetical protein
MIWKPDPDLLTEMNRVGVSHRFLGFEGTDDTGPTSVRCACGQAMLPASTTTIRYHREASRLQAVAAWMANRTSDVLRNDPHTTAADWAAKALFPNYEEQTTGTPEQDPPVSPIAKEAELYQSLYVALNPDDREAISSDNIRELIAAVRDSYPSGDFDPDSRTCQETVAKAAGSYWSLGVAATVMQAIQDHAATSGTEVLRLDAAIEITPGGRLDQACVEVQRLKDLDARAGDQRPDALLGAAALLIDALGDNAHPCDTDRALYMVSAMVRGHRLPDLRRLVQYDEYTPMVKYLTERLKKAFSAHSNTGYTTRTIAAAVWVEFPDCRFDPDSPADRRAVAESVGAHNQGTVEDRQIQEVMRGMLAWPKVKAATSADQAGLGSE